MKCGYAGCELFAGIRNNSAFVVVLDELNNFVGFQCVYKSFDLRRRLVALFYRDNIDVLLDRITVSGLDGKSIGTYIESCLQRVVAVDNAERNARKLFGNLCSLNFYEVQVQFVLFYIINGSAPTPSLSLIRPSC